MAIIYMTPLSIFLRYTNSGRLSKRWLRSPNRLWYKPQKTKIRKMGVIPFPPYVSVSLRTFSKTYPCLCLVEAETSYTFEVISKITALQSLEKLICSNFTSRHGLTLHTYLALFTTVKNLTSFRRYTRACYAVRSTKLREVDKKRREHTPHHI